MAGVSWLCVVWALLLTREAVSAAYMTGFDPVELSSMEMEKKDDTWVEIPVDAPFPFYNKLYDGIFINEDGILTLGAPIPNEVPGSLSLPIFDADFSDDVNLDRERMVIIAPFWTEVNTEKTGSTGTVYYQSGLDRANQVLLDAEAIVKSCFIDEELFVATRGMVVTWDEVSNTDDSSKKNSFQAILVYDSVRSFVIFYYSAMQYAKGISFSPVGFNAGDISGGMSYPVASQSAYQALPDGTNCDSAGIKGAYVFRVDTEKLSSPGCDVTSDYYAVQVSPTSGPMLGGNRISIAPNCDLTGLAVCVFRQGDSLLQTAGASPVGTVVVCVPGPFFVTGEVSVLVYQTIEESEDPSVTASYTVKYTVEHPDDSTVGVRRSSPTSSAWDAAGSSLTVTWDPALFAEEESEADPTLPLLRVSLLQYDESESADGTPAGWRSLYELGAGVQNRGTFSFTAEPLENVTEANPWGVIRVERTGTFPVALYTDVHMFGYVLHQMYQDDPENWAEVECQRWDGEEDQSLGPDGLPSFLADVPPCPCTLIQARRNAGRFTEQRGGCALSAAEQSCTRQAHTDRVCFLSTGTRAGAECCYDAATGQLIFSLDDPTGGTADKAASLGTPPYAQPGHTPFLSHWAADVVPYHLCCRWASNSSSCRTYLENRWPKDCSGYGERQSAFIFGDPHIVTFDQRRYTFNGIGEYRLMEVQEYDLKLYGRTMMATEAGLDGIPVASYLDAVAMREEGSDTIHIELGEIRPLNLFYDMGDGFRQPSLWLASNAYEPVYLRGATLTVSSDFTQITVAFLASSVTVVVKAYSRGITAEVTTSRAEMGNSVRVTGLLGDMDGLPDNDIRNANGVVYEGDDPEELFNTLQEWMTLDTDTIFHLDGAQTQSSYKNLTFVPTLVTPDPSTLDQSISSRLEEVCQGLAECIFDMSVTQTEDAGVECYQENAEYLERQEILVKVRTCPYIPAPADGKVSFSDPLRRYEVGTDITFSCDDATSIVFGPATRTCVAETEDDSSSAVAWSDSTLPDCTETKCNTNDVKGADVIATSTDADGNLLVTFGCPGTNVEYQLTCKGGQWEGSRVDCSTGGGGVSGGAVAGIVIAVLLLVGLVLLLVVFLFKRSDHGVRNLDKTGTKVNENHPSENWGMEKETPDVSAAMSAGTKFGSVEV